MAWGDIVGSERVCISPLSLFSEKWEEEVVDSGNDSLTYRLLEDTASKCFRSRSGIKVCIAGSLSRLLCSRE